MEPSPGGFVDRQQVFGGSPAAGSDSDVIDNTLRHFTEVAQSGSGN